MIQYFIGTKHGLSRFIKFVPAVDIGCMTILIQPLAYNNTVMCHTKDHKTVVFIGYCNKELQA